MKLFNFKEASSDQPEKSNQKCDLLFASVAALERALDGQVENFYRYFYVLYHCSPDEISDLNTYRNQLKDQFPEKSVSVGRHFVLWGEPAFRVASSYYNALATRGEPREFREYAKQQYIEIEQKHKRSQSLAVPIDLSEGQLCNDKKLDFYTCLALSNGQVIKK